jgi:hypothetical protein
MGETVPVAVVIGAFSALIALLSLTWGIWSWRMTGSKIRVHALLYRDVLMVRAFNAGRTADTIDQLVLGGTRGGFGGHDLTDHIGGPQRLEVGQSARWTIDREQLPFTRAVSAERGWDNLWLLLGSMRQLRAEVLPVPGVSPPTVGWKLVPRRARLSRYVPLAAAATVFVSLSGWTAVTGVCVLFMAAVVIIRLYASFVGSQPSRRLRTERWATALGLALAILLAAVAGPDSEAPGTAAEVIAAAYAIAAVIIAIPGGVSRLRDEAVLIRSRAGQRFPRRRQNGQDNAADANHCGGAPNVGTHGSMRTSSA